MTDQSKVSNLIFDGRYFGGRSNDKLGLIGDVLYVTPATFHELHAAEISEEPENNSRQVLLKAGLTEAELAAMEKRQIEVRVNWEWLG